MIPIYIVLVIVADYQANLTRKYSVPFTLYNNTVHMQVKQSVLNSVTQGRRPTTLQSLPLTDCEYHLHMNGSDGHQLINDIRYSKVRLLYK
jgi:hypothetical protein